MVYSDMESHLMKLRLCFQKCKENRISLNPKKCAFMVFSGGKNTRPPKMLRQLLSVPINPQQIHVFNGMAQFYKCVIKNFAFIMALITKLMKKTKPFIWTIEC